MKTTNKLNQLENEFDYFDYLVSVQDKPHHDGAIENIKRRIKVLKRIKSKNSSDIKTFEITSMILQKYETLQERYYSLYPKK